jgi:chorismate dehydratase
MNVTHGREHETTAGGPPIRVGAVSYLNTKPLVYRLGEIAPFLQLSFDLPSRLADKLAEGALDVALIPSVEFFQNPAYTIVSDACIGCRGPVWSVKLFSRVPPAEIKSLALDEGSRTSAALVQILLHEKFGISPERRPLPIGSSVDASEADAVLLIGDRAMHAPPGEFAAVWDLGDAWRAWSGLPFVFAMWVARAGVPLDRLRPALCAARDAGVAHLPEIADREGPPLGITPAQCLAYLRDNLHFQLGPSERRGLQRFYERVAALHLAPSGCNLEFAHC